MTLVGGLGSLITAIGADIKNHATRLTNIEAYPSQTIIAKTFPSLGSGTATAVGNVNVNNAAEITLATLVVDHTKYAAQDMLYLEFLIDAYNNSGAARSYTFKVKANTTSILVSSSAIADVASQRTHLLMSVPIGLAGLSDQRWGGMFIAGQSTGANNMNQLAALGNQGIGGVNTTQDWSTDPTIAITAQMATAHASEDVRLCWAVIRRAR